MQQSLHPCISKALYVLTDLVVWDFLFKEKHIHGNKFSKQWYDASGHWKFLASTEVYSRKLDLYTSTFLSLGRGKKRETGICRGSSAEHQVRSLTSTDFERTLLCLILVFYNLLSFSSDSPVTRELSVNIQRANNELEPGSNSLQNRNKPNTEWYDFWQWTQLHLNSFLLFLLCHFEHDDCALKYKITSTLIQLATFNLSYQDYNVIFQKYVSQL